MPINQPEPFYDTIADKYHWFFSSWENATNNDMGLICPVFEKHGVKTVLDCSCGSGLQAIGLAKRGYKVEASDISGVMIDEATRLAEKEKVDIKFRQADFRELGKYYKGEYDAVISWGNSIPHLMSDTDIEKALTEIYALTKKGGIAMFSMRNYDLMIKDKKRFHPMRINDIKDNKRYSIVYVFDYHKSKICFNIIYLIEDLETGLKHMESESVDYNPIKKDKFISLVHKVGFKNITYTENGNINYLAEK
ncbi:MAG: hypothetical protein CVU97_01050 [Firmicutes bacterium HGW-Firmicutes-21]|nr:MAG: hypothetical protein CVU97_01050 [Firmicutes bacterium HGW-Firmicutes-21]